MTIELLAHDLQWIQGYDDDPDDQCAHGRVSFRINETVFIKPEDGVWTLSAAGLFLLRTLEHDHSPLNPVAENNFLFPCCGFSVWAVGKGNYLVICFGCDHGINLQITSKNGVVNIKNENKEETIDFTEWRNAVFEFCDRIRSFYDAANPKIAPQDNLDAEGWYEFWKEWFSRRQREYIEIPILK